MAKSTGLARRAALKTIGGATALTTLSAGWIKPVVDAVVLPAHAETTSPIILPECYPISLRIFDLSDAGQSGGNGSFQIEITTTAPDSFNQVTVSASVNNGELVGDTSGNIYVGNSLIFGWFGPAIPGTAIPLEPTVLTVDWVCADDTTGSETYDLVDLVSQLTEEQPVSDLDQSLTILTG